MDSINVLYADMPPRIKAYTVKCSDLSYTIVLNSKLSKEQNERSYWHELSHIQNGDYDLKCDAGLIEFFSHK